MKKRRLAVWLLFAWLCAVSVSAAGSYADANADAFDAAGEGEYQWEWQPTEAFLESESGNEYEDDHNVLDDEFVTHLQDFNLDLPAQGIELTLSCERHDFTQYAGSQSMECPLSYDLVTLTGNLPGIESVNEQISNDFQDYKAAIEAGYASYLETFDYDPPAEYIDTVELIVDNYWDGYNTGLQYYDGRYISLYYDTMWCGGGAVVESNAHCMTFDLQSGQMLSAADLFGNSSKVKAYMIEKVTDTMRTAYGVTQLDEYASRELNALDLASISFFLAQDGELVLCFDRYDLGEGALGSPMIATGIYLGEDISEAVERAAGPTIYHSGSEIRVSDVLGSTSFEDYVNDSDSKQYNPKLAYLLAGLSRSAYNKEDIDKSLASLGFESRMSANYEGDDGFAGYFIAKKKMADGSTLVLVVFRGSFTVGNWIGDLAAVASKAFIGFHSAFEMSEKDAYQSLKSYLGNDIPTRNTKYVITGHSLGGAVGNILAVKLSDAGVPAENVYDYNFACPDVARKFWVDWNPNGVHDNMFNLADVRDPVACYPGVVGNGINLLFTWGKFGRSYWFSYNWSLQTLADWGAHDAENYVKYFSRLKDDSSFRDWAGAKAAQGASFVDSVIYGVNSVLPWNWGK